LATAFLISAATAVAVRGSGWSTRMENGKYYLSFKSDRYETTAEEFNRTEHHNRIAGWAVFCMFASAGGFIAIEAINYPRGHNLRRRRVGN
jgi:hypothetical protein